MSSSSAIGAGAAVNVNPNRIDAYKNTSTYKAYMSLRHCLENKISTSGFNKIEAGKILNDIEKILFLQSPQRSNKTSCYLVAYTYGQNQDLISKETLQFLDTMFTESVLGKNNSQIAGLSFNDKVSQFQDAFRSQYNTNYDGYKSDSILGPKTCLSLLIDYLLQHSSIENVSTAKNVAFILKMNLIYGSESMTSNGNSETKKLIGELSAFGYGHIDKLIQNELRSIGSSQGEIEKLNQKIRKILIVLDKIDSYNKIIDKYAKAFKLFKEEYMVVTEGKYSVKEGLTNEQETKYQKYLKMFREFSPKISIIKKYKLTGEQLTTNKEAVRVLLDQVDMYDQSRLEDKSYFSCMPLILAISNVKETNTPEINSPATTLVADKSSGYTSSMPEKISPRKRKEKYNPPRAEKPTEDTSFVQTRVEKKPMAEEQTPVSSKNTASFDIDSKLKGLLDIVNTSKFPSGFFNNYEDLGQQNVFNDVEDIDDIQKQDALQGLFLLVWTIYGLDISKSYKWLSNNIKEISSQDIEKYYKNQTTQNTNIDWKKLAVLLETVAKDPKHLFYIGMAIRLRNDKNVKDAVLSAKDGIAYVYPYLKYLEEVFNDTDKISPLVLDSIKRNLDFVETNPKDDNKYYSIGNQLKRLIEDSNWKQYVSTLSGLNSIAMDDIYGVVNVRPVAVAVTEAKAKAATVAKAATPEPSSIMTDGQGNHFIYDEKTGGTYALNMPGDNSQRRITKQDVSTPTGAVEPKYKDMAKSIGLSSERAQIDTKDFKKGMIGNDDAYVFGRMLYIPYHNTMNDGSIEYYYGTRNRQQDYFTLLNKKIYNEEKNTINWDELKRVEKEGIQGLSKFAEKTSLQVMEPMYSDTKQFKTLSKTTRIAYAGADEILYYKLLSNESEEYLFAKALSLFHSGNKPESIKYLGLLFEHIYSNEEDNDRADVKAEKIISGLINDVFSGDYKKFQTYIFDNLSKVTPPFIAKRFLYTNYRYYIENKLNVIGINNISKDVSSFIEKITTYFKQELKKNESFLADNDVYRRLNRGDETVDTIAKDSIEKLLDNNCCGENYYYNKMIYEGILFKPLGDLSNAGGIREEDYTTDPYTDAKIKDWQSKLDDLAQFNSASQKKILTDMVDKLVIYN